MSALLAAEGLSKSFGGVAATRDVSLTVQPGELHALIGPNGAGKTTLIGLLAGDLRPDRGTIRLDGRAIERLPGHARARAGLARSFQITRLALGLSVRDNALLGVAGTLGHAFRARPARSDPALTGPAEAALAEAGLAAVAERPAGTLSHGERRQLELALALLARPRLLLLDEPLAGLGPGEAEAMVARLAALKGRYGILLVEHDVDAVFELADTVTVLAEGAVVATGAAAAVRADGRVRRVYLGE